MTELASIYGKVGSVGFETESVNQLASRGLNVSAIWAKRDDISEAEVQKNISAKKYGPDARSCTARHGLLPSAGGAGRAVDHGKRMCRWRVSERSADGSGD